MRKIRYYLQMLTIMFMLGMPVIANAQGPIDDDPPGDPGDPGGDPDTPIPFDDNIMWFVAAGVIYGLKKAYDAKNRSVLLVK